MGDCRSSSRMNDDGGGWFLAIVGGKKGLFAYPFSRRTRCLTVGGCPSEIRISLTEFPIPSAPFSDKIACAFVRMHDC